MLRSRRRSVPRFGLWSIALWTWSPTTTKVTGTRCGTPSASAVPSTACRAPANLALACAESTPPTLEQPEPHRLGDRGRAVVDAELAEGPHQVGLHRRLADEQLAADLGVGQ